MKKTYLYRLFKHDKILGTIVALFCMGTVFFNLIGDQVFPFFVWGMFSKIEHPQVEYEVMEMEIDGEKLNPYDLTDINRNIFTTNLSNYKALVQNNGEDPTRTLFKKKFGKHYPKIQNSLEKITNSPQKYDDFKKWLIRYTEESVGHSFEHLKVWTGKYAYNEEGIPVLKNRELLMDLDANEDDK